MPSASLQAALVKLAFVVDTVRYGIIWAVQNFVMHDT